MVNIVLAKCPIGTEGISGICRKCSIGYYQDIEGSIDCIKCPKGTTTQKDGAKYLSSCQSKTCKVKMYIKYDICV